VWALAAVKALVVAQAAAAAQEVAAALEPVARAPVGRPKEARQLAQAAAPVQEASQPAAQLLRAVPVAVGQAALAVRSRSRASPAGRAKCARP